MRNSSAEGWDNLLASSENHSRAKSQIPIQGPNHRLFCAFYFLLTKKTVFSWISIPSDTAGFAAQSWNIPGVGRADEALVSHEQTLPHCATCAVRVMFSPPARPLLARTDPKYLVPFYKIPVLVSLSVFAPTFYLFLGAVKPGLTRKISHNLCTASQGHS